MKNEIIQRKFFLNLEKKFHNFYYLNSYLKSHPEMIQLFPVSNDLGRIDTLIKISLNEE
jgi:hypothetical protein